MRIHNIMEDLVLGKVKEIFEEEKTSRRRGFCTKPSCEIDVACYILNRIPPKYIVSGRGLAHYEIDYLDRLQNEADLVSLIFKAAEIITETKRKHRDEPKEKAATPKGYFYNIPILLGRIFNSENFEPISGVYVSLLHDGNLLEMVNSNWENPQKLAVQTAGYFNFWPRPFPASKIGEERTFEFEITIDDKKYEPLRHYFNVGVASEENYVDYYRINQSIQIKDLYLMPK